MLTRSKRDSKTNVNIGKDEQTKVNARKKEKNYTQEEDIFLCRAWMTTPGDPDEDTDPSSRTFWERVKEKYTSLTGNSYAVRAGKSLPQRWSRIRAAVFKFCVIYKNISDQNPNCYSEQDMIKMALLAYKKEQKENFNFRHCWTELRNSLKWNREGALKVRRKNITQQSLINEHFNLDDNDDCPLPADMPLEQSERKKHSKRRAGKDNDAVVISPYPEPSPISAVSMSAFVCSSGDMDSKTRRHVEDDMQTELTEQVNTRKKESNFTQEEDIFLCRAWMETKVDPMIGRDQFSITLWSKIGEAYAKLIGDNHAPRVGKSLPHRWSRIRTAVQKFCSIYKNIDDQKPNRYTEVDKINLTVLAFQKEQKEKFKFLHCWTELRHSRKWNFETAYGNQYRGRHAAKLSRQSPSGGHFSRDDDDDDDSPMPTPPSLDQLKEQEQAGQKSNRQNVDTSSSDMEELRSRDLLRDILVNQPKAEKSVVRKRKARDGNTGSSEVGKHQHSQDLAREMLEIEREKRETKIMLIDPYTIPDGRRQYFKKLQQNILERVCGTPPRSN